MSYTFPLIQSYESWKIDGFTKDAISSNEAKISLIATQSLSPSDLEIKARELSARLIKKHDRFKARVNGDKIEILDTTQFEEGLKQWVEKEGGRAKEAADLITNAFYEDSESLSLVDFRLSSLPSEIGQLFNLKSITLSSNRLGSLPAEIGQLSKLKYLYLISNQLSSIPPEIGQLCELKELILNTNRLSSLPAEIGKLSKLKHLCLVSNQLSSLPAEIGQLSRLETLNLNKNRLSSIPPEIGQLYSLMDFYLNENLLSTLPAEIGQLFNLITLHLGSNQLTTLPTSLGQLLYLRLLNISYNPSLYQLPLSLNQCSNLIALETEGTIIPLASQEAVIEVTQEQRRANALFALPQRLKAWQSLVAKAYNLSFIENLEPEQKQIINEWLERLERARDFSSSQKQLAQVVLDILETAGTSDSFKELFFVQVEANNTGCGDRAAMALNEIFVAWKIESFEKESSTKEKLQLMASAAKTLALREALQNALAGRTTGLEESVEIYLYYEIALKNRLNLLTAVSSMAYKSIGERDWIQESELAEYVRTTYLDHLVDLRAFKNLIKQDPDFNSSWDSMEEAFEQTMERLEQEKDQDSEGVYLQRCNQLKRDREMAWKKLAIKWVNRFLD